ncbi:MULTISPECIES: hypothetical protein [unclassified Nostoc]|uniref:hypothetical protein n=1 Tax=unclassified Nostoc TaxID=2593658 RepID=UPI002AD2969D|nr:MULTISPECIES: hypothetical protein [unclassified Nostoc]MDZ7985343.1 hypothetical protein [Nostoc sp. DedVER02]MDZ8116809.1 hypothetical protein [Nostoc sp. DedVER01b]
MSWFLINIKNTLSKAIISPLQLSIFSDTTSIQLYKSNIEVLTNTVALNQLWENNKVVNVTKYWVQNVEAIAN